MRSEAQPRLHPAPATSPPCIHARPSITLTVLLSTLSSAGARPLVHAPTHPTTAPDPAAAFIARWRSSGAAERANYQLFLSELCDLPNVPRPDPNLRRLRDRLLPSSAS